MWRILAPEETVVSKLVSELGVTPYTAIVLCNRGITDSEKAKGYIGEPLKLLYDPFLFSQMERAVERIRRAIKKGEKILIFGDYDADGLTGAAVIFLLLKECGAEVDVFIPHRMNHGYGLTSAALGEINPFDYRLVITVDCGITSVCEVGSLASSGVDVIITDHHTPGVFLPPAHAVVNPRMDVNYPFNGLAGVGVAMKLAEALALAEGGEEERRRVLKRFMPFVALGTIADVMELVDENRFFVKYGIKMIPHVIGLRALMEVAGIADRQLDVYDLSFILAPRINAPGRMSHALKAFELLTTCDVGRAEEVAKELNRENSKRQREEEKVVSEALSMFKEEDPVAVMWKEGWHPGVIGIAASKISRKVKRPCVLVSFNGSEEGRGSGRSFGEVDLYKLLSPASRHMRAYGGHKKAVGFSVRKDKISAVYEEIIRAAEGLEVSEEAVKVDAVMKLEDLEVSFLRELIQLTPFGEGFEEPLFLFEGVRVRNLRPMSNGGYMFEVVQDKVAVDAVCFEPLEEITGVGRYDLVASVEISQWKGTKRLRLRCKDARRRG